MQALSLSAKECVINKLGLLTNSSVDEVRTLEK